MKRVKVYIDGLNLHYGMLSQEYDRYLWLDLAKFGQKLTEEQDTLIGVEYFTARFKKDLEFRPGRHERQDSFLSANRQSHIVTLRESYFVSVKCDCATCFHAPGNRPEYRYNEKLTDTHIASRMIGDAVRDLYDIAVLVSRDNDLAPPIREVHALFPDKQVIVASPTMKIGKILQMAANSTFVIEERVFAESQLPDAVAARRGKTLTRPKEWT